MKSSKMIKCQAQKNPPWRVVACGPSPPISAEGFRSGARRGCYAAVGSLESSFAMIIRQIDMTDFTSAGSTSYS